MKEKRNIIVSLYKKMGPIANRCTNSYEAGFGLPCDLYFPIHSPKRGGTYQMVSLFEPHELPDYPEEPSVKNVYFYIPHLIKKESMNSIVDAFDNFALKAESGSDRPFIETTPDKELPIATKVVVHLDSSELAYYIDKKTVVNGAGNQLLMRQYLSPLTKDKSVRED